MRWSEWTGEKIQFIPAATAGDGYIFQRKNVIAKTWRPILTAGKYKQSKLFAACCGVNAAENIEFLGETAGAPPRKRKQKCSPGAWRKKRRRSPGACIFSSAKREYSAAFHTRMQLGASAGGRQFPPALWSNLFQEREREREKPATERRADLISDLILGAPRQSHHRRPRCAPRCLHAMCCNPQG